MVDVHNIYHKMFSMYSTILTSWEKAKQISALICSCGTAVSTLIYDDTIGATYQPLSMEHGE